MNKTSVTSEHVNTDPVAGSETDRITDESMFVLLDLHHFLGLDFWVTVVMDDTNATTQLLEGRGVVRCIG